jgi:hypothetical protein
LQTAAAQFTLALQVITDQVQDCPSQMQCFDLWMQQHAVLDIPIRLDCPTCQQRLFPLLEGKNGPRSQWLCGRTAIQLSHSSLDAASLRLIAQRFAPQVQRMSLYHLELDWMLSQQSHRLTLFQDGRLIVNNCHDEKQAQLILQSVLGGIANDLS